MTEQLDLVGRTLRYCREVGRGRGRRMVPEPGSEIRITRPGKREGDWLGVMVHPRPDEDPGYEWRVTREQIEDGRYVVCG